MTAAYHVVCSQDAWCRSDNDRHSVSLKPSNPGMLLHLGYSSKLNALALNGVRACPGERAHVPCITTLGHTKSTAVELCFDAFRIPSCPDGFTIRISSRLTISRLKLIYQLSSLRSLPLIFLTLHATTHFATSELSRVFKKAVILLRHCKDFQIEFWTLETASNLLATVSISIISDSPSQQYTAGHLYH